MELKYNSKYRISSVRLAGWDYGAQALYFVTICTKDRQQYFGKIENGSSIEGIASLRATEIGKVAHDNWANIPSYHPYVELDEFVVMPDHIHGILFIYKPEKDSWEINKFGPQRKNLVSIVRGYKASVKTYSTFNNIDFCWQSRFYDRVIRNENEYLNIKKYIVDNPDQWFLNNDDFENLFKP